MPAGRDQRREASLLEGLRGLWDLGAGTLRGGVSSLVGAPGDVEELVRQLRSSPSPRVLPTTDEIKQYLPGTGAETTTAETLGEYMNPVTPAKKVVLATKGAGALGGAVKAGLYANALRKDLLLSHDAGYGSLMKTGDLPKELYNLSLGITKDKPMSFGSGNTLLIPKLGAFDPKTSPTSLHAFDAYTPRWGVAQGRRADDIPAAELVHKLREYADDPVQGPGVRRIYENSVEQLRNAANKRLVDRFISQHPRGGVFGEGQAAPKLTSLPHYGEGGFSDAFSLKHPGSGSLQEFSYARRFPSFQAYERSPYGAKRLDEGPAASELINAVNEFVHAKSGELNDVGLGLTGMRDSELRDSLLAMAGRDKKGLFPAPTVKTAKQLAEQLRRTKSDYGELKAWGPVGLHSDNFAGIITSPHLTTSELETLERAAKKRGLHFAVKPSSHVDEKARDYEKRVFDLAKQMQGVY